jgi:hypothetical protein
MRHHLEVSLRSVLATIVLAWAPFVCMSACPEDQPSFAKVAKASDVVEVRGPLDVAELENQHRITIRETGEVLPFGYMNREWIEFKSTMVDGDKIYFIARRQGLFYLDGHVLFRGDCAIRFLRRSIS